MFDAKKTVFKQELRFGDVIFVTTQNSNYYLNVLDSENVIVFGGWFEKKGRSPEGVSVNGCTWGTSCIATSAVAAHGMRLEFGNGVITSRIKEIFFLHASGLN